MAQPASRSRVPELREMVKENDRRVFNFVSMLLSDPEVVEATVLKTFADFGALYRRLVKSKSNYDGEVFKIRLFQCAWKNVQMQSEGPPVVAVGRDTRDLVQVGENLLRASEKNSGEKVFEKVADRIRSLDLDFRAPLILRDLLGFEDEQALTILGLRWGVYRHRLNRGRLDLKECLSGRVVPMTGIKPSAELRL